MTYIRFTIEAAEPDQDILISQLALYDAVGFEQTDTQLLAYFNWESVAEDKVHEVLKKFVFKTDAVEEQNWNATWEASFEPVVVGNFCAVRAHFHPPVSGVTHEIVITPKMSFGTGHHATTYMMLAQMQQIVFTHKTVLDFGTGTGVLAILAEKCGAAAVTAIDNDAWSFDNVQENLHLNNCLKVDAQLTEVIAPQQPYDIILANITKNVLLSYMGLLKTCLKPGGTLLLSGLLEPDFTVMEEACLKEGMKLVRHMERNSWLSMLFLA